MILTFKGDMISVSDRFGRLIVLSLEDPPVYSNGRRKLRWICRCDCGTQKVVGHGALRRGQTQSCGCLRKEIAKQQMTTHGQGRAGNRSATWYSWIGMNSRCHNPNSTGFKNYGGRGITVCERWRKFENFIADMGERPKGTTLDRINNNGDYEPKNCRWTSMCLQRRNKRNVQLAFLDGSELTRPEVAKILGVTTTTIHRRLQKGFSLQEVLQGMK